MTRLLKKLLIVSGLLYLLFCGGIYLFQDHLIFDPRPLAADYRFGVGEEVNVAVGEGISLNCLWVREQPSKGVILYLHGNRGSNRRCLRQARGMMGNGYDLFMPDYRGYGKSQGRISSEAQLLADAQAVYDFLKQHYAEHQIVLVGYSLGSGMASYLAAHNHPRQLVLLAPYLSLTDMKDRMLPFVPDFLVKYPLSNQRFLQQARCPAILFHGEEDEVIPFEASVKLQAQNPQRVQLVPVQRTGHRGLIFSPTFTDHFRRLLARG